MHNLFELAERHVKFKRDVFEKLQQQSMAEIESLATKEARIVYEWNRQVAGCFQRSRAFMRLKISPHSIVYGELEPEHFVEDMVARWFLSRFPLFTIMIESKRGTIVVAKGKPLQRYTEKIDELLPQFEKQLPKNDILSEIGEFKEDDYWENYYSSQFIIERRNKRYFLRNIPKKFHNWKSLATEKEHFENNKKLTQF